MRKEDIVNEYFNWLYEIVCEERYGDGISYRKLLMHLHRTEFTYLISTDKQRAADGIALRYRFELACDHMPISRYLDGPCSVLEMMVALAIRCEETIMDDPLIGDRTTQWFWGMITNLGLGNMSDGRYDRNFVQNRVDRFLNRSYASDGHGGLFTVRESDQDMRDVEIWTQMLYYLDSIL